MDISRIHQLREQLEEEAIDTAGLIEIEEAFAQIPDEELSEARENAMAIDMLDELESRVSPVELTIYNYVAEHYGENEADNPSWAIGLLADDLESRFIIKAKETK